MFSEYQNNLPSFISNLNNDRREGTLNQGVDYEQKICALIALRAIFAPKNFWIMQNVQDQNVGLFDDIVFVLENQDKQVDVYCIQLKHFSGKRKRQKLTLGAFQQENTKNTKNPLLLDAYFKSIQSSVKELNIKGQNVNYILFTNREAHLSEKSFVLCPENSDISLINTGGIAFKFNKFQPLKSTECVDKSLLDHFMVFSNQSHEENVVQLIENELRAWINFPAESLKDVLFKYLKYIADWTKGYYGGNRPLFKEEVKFKLTEIVFNPFVYQFPEKLSSCSLETLHVWNRITRMHKNVLIQYCNNAEVLEQCSAVISGGLRVTLEDFFGIEVTEETKKSHGGAFCNIVQDMLFLWGVEFDNISPQMVHYYLWMKNVLPLVVLVEKHAFLGLLKFASFISWKLIFLCSENFPIPMETQLGKPFLVSFNDLSPFVQRLILQQSVTFQGRTMKAGHVLRDPEVVSRLSVVQIVQILLNGFQIGDDCPQLPKIFIGRFLTNIFATAEVFQGTVIRVIQCESKEDFLEYASRSNLQFDESQMQTVFFDGNSGKISGVILNSSYKIFLVVGDEFNQVRKAIQQQQKSAVKCIFFKLQDEVLQVDENEAMVVNVIIGSRELLQAFLTTMSITFENWEIYSTSDVNIQRLPLTCKYLVSAQDKDAELFRNIFSEKLSFHFYKIHVSGESYVLEFLGSLGPSNRIKKFLETSQDLPNKYDFSNCFRYNNLNLIGGPPGMGKSVLINYLIRTCPPSFWTILVNFNTQLKYFTEHTFPREKAIEHLNRFSKYESLSEIERSIFDCYLREKKICIFFDAYDEIDPKLESKVDDFLQHLLILGFTLFLTSRTIKVGELQSKLSVASRKIIPFVVEDQSKYLVDYYQLKTGESEEKIKTFVKNLLAVTGSDMSAWDLEFSGIPLQTIMISEIYLSACKEFCESGKSDLCGNVDILQLYEQFIEFKISNLKYKDEIDDPRLENYFYDSIDQSLEKHKLCAIKAIFPSLSSEIDITDFAAKIKNRKDKIGLIERFVESDTPVFVHRTFAEYLVGLYVSDNFTKHFVRRLLDQIFKNSIYDIVRQIVDRLLSKGSVLHRAILNQDSDTFRSLVKDERNLLQVDKGRRNVLHLAMSWGRRHEIIDDGVINEWSELAEWHHFQKLIVGIFKRLRAQRGTENLAGSLLDEASHLLYETDEVLGGTPFEYAVKSCSLKNVDLYLETILRLEGSFEKIRSNFYNLVRFDGQGQDGYSHKQLLLACSMYDHVYVANAISWLRPDGCNIDVNFGKYDISLLHVAALCRSDKVIDILVNEGIDVDNTEKKKNRSALHLASLMGNTSTVQLLLKKQANIHLLDWSKRSALYFAKWNRHTDIVELLTEAESNVGGRKTKITDLFLASVAGNLERVEELLASGADPNEMSDGGGRPLMEASAEGHLKIVEVLLKFGATPNAVTDNNWTSLMWACMRGHQDIVKVLLSSGASVNCVSKFGDTALSLAKKNHHLAIESALCDAGTHTRSGCFEHLALRK